MAEPHDDQLRKHVTIFEKIMIKDVANPATLWGALVYALLLLLIAGFGAYFLRFSVVRLLKRDEAGRIDRSVAMFLTQLGQIGIYVIALIFYAHLVPALRAVGTALLAGAGIASIVVGLAAQNTLGNMVAGISLLLYRPFHVGDRLQISAPTGLETGDVESLTLGYTVLRSFDNRRIVVPNSIMASQTTVNLTTEDPRVMAVVPISIGYTSDLDQSRAILMALAQTHPKIQSVVGCPVTQLGDSSVTLSLRVWCANAEDAKCVQFDLYEQAKKRFDQEGIEIPYPYTNIVLKKEKLSSANGETS